jgi:hypothetical protein
VVRALRVDGWDPLEVEIGAGDPTPSVQLHGDMAERATALEVEIRVSLTHLPSMAAAVAITFPRDMAAPQWAAACTPQPPSAASQRRDGAPRNNRVVS